MTNMKQIIDSCEKVFRQKLSNSVYGNFVFFWVAFHWEFLFSIFALDDNKILEKTGFLKNEYLISKFFDFSDWYFYFSWIMPFILTYFAIWYLQKWVIVPAFKKDEEIKTAKELIRISEEKKRQQGEKELVDVEVEKLEATERKVAIKRNMESQSPEIVWEAEYKILKNSGLYDEFNAVIECYYKWSGSLLVSNQFKLGKNMQAYIDSNDLAVFRIDGGIGNAPSIELTKKGKYFVKRFLEDRVQKGYTVPDF